MTTKTKIDWTCKGVSINKKIHELNEELYLSSSGNHVLPVNTLLGKLNNLKNLIKQIVTIRRCAWCNADVKLSKFKDSLSRKEYDISGFCQDCQDATYRELN